MGLAFWPGVPPLAERPRFSAVKRVPLCSTTKLMGGSFGAFFLRLGYLEQDAGAYCTHSLYANIHYTLAQKYSVVHIKPWCVESDDARVDTSPPQSDLDDFL